MKIVQLLLLLLLFACQERKQRIAKFQDYDRYLSTKQFVSNDPAIEETRFWTERLEQNPNDEISRLKLAGLHAALFRTTGIIGHILASDSLYNQTLQKFPEENVEIYHALASNAISQHKFQEAKHHAEKALTLKDKKAASLLILVDVSLEVGDYARANQIMRQFKNKSSFAYLIRKAKLNDHEGRLDSAIVCMEKAYDRVKGNRELSQWALSNLGDMYGHAGRIEDSYQTYLSVLKNNPDDDYCLRRIAWISLSHDGNTTEAKRIINAVSTRKSIPDAELLLAEIAEVEGDELQKIAHRKKFRQLVSDPAYKKMYHKYLSLLEAEEFNNPAAAIAIAQEEIANRPTPQSYDLLAWAYYHQGEFDKALQIANRHVQNQTYEPDALYHLGMIHLANKNMDQAVPYLTEALTSEFELGPSVSAKIRATLKNL